jgi:DNA-binding XRE family transcriptional regulator
VGKLKSVDVLEAREKMSLTQKELARKCGVSTKTIARLEKGAHVRPIVARRVSAQLKLGGAPTGPEWPGYSPTRTSAPIPLKRGLDVLDYIANTATRHVDVHVRDEIDATVDDGIRPFVDAIERLRAEVGFGPRLRYECLRDFGRAARALQKSGWIIEASKYQKEAGGEEAEYCDEVIYASFELRKATGSSGKTAPSGKQRAARGHRQGDRR